MSGWIATRAAAQARLDGFVPRMGRRYANGRNTDHGPGRHEAVSGLSPYLRRRMLLDSQVVAAALSAHGLAGAEKLIQEVLWRSYFKGWLEQRPQVWDSYVQGLAEDRQGAEADPRLRRRLARAMAGQTGLDCFDAWVGEVVDTGYLHNHARMWFASIWIFTLDLPWRIGADFLYRHLLDGDAASNTLGWRWVAGLHTRGKPYAAEAANIAAFTAGRFTPRPSNLAEVTQGLEMTEPQGLPPLLPLRRVVLPRPDLPSALLISDEDCRPEDFTPGRLDIRARATLASGHLRSQAPVSPLVLGFEEQALADTAAHLGGGFQPLVAQDPAALARWAEGHGARQIVTAYVPCGPLRDWLLAATPALAARGIALCEWQRDWDRVIWPHATAGFFKLRQRIPALLDQLLPDVEQAGEGAAGQVIRPRASM